MDRCHYCIAPLLLSLLITGCSTTQSSIGSSYRFSAGCGGGAQQTGCGSDCSTCGEDCNGTCGSCPNQGCTQNGCGCTDGCGAGCSCGTGNGCGTGCSGEGCNAQAVDYSRGSRFRGRFSGLEGGFERGRPNLLLDGAGWIAGIPSKLLLWNTKIDSHSVSPETEYALRRYMNARGLTDVKVRLNQYDPIGEWKRLAQNKSIHPLFKYTVGTYAVSKYTLLPGRLFGNDEYNPFTNSISLYSDRQSIALREGAHAKRAVEANLRGLYSSSMYIPASPLWVDTSATREVLSYTQEIGNRLMQRESYLVLFPAYGARIGQSLTGFIDVGQGQAATAGLALLGHAVGRTMAFRVSDTPMQMVKSVYGIVRRPVDEDQPIAEQLQDVLPPNEIAQAGFEPLDVTYESYIPAYQE